MNNNSKGFTLIELLAVITIMGILMMVAIPTVSRTIENSRKDTFIDMVKQYVSSVQNMWAADNLECAGFVSSAVKSGAYYVEVNTMSDSIPQLLEQGGKSPWGNRDIIGIIGVAVRMDGSSRKITYYPAFVDGIHGINVKPDGSGTVRVWKSADKLTRGDLVMSNARYGILATQSGSTWNVKSDMSFSVDLNDDGDKDDVVDGLAEANVLAVKCVER